MAELVAEFFLVSGLDINPPSNISELIPYLLRVIVALCLVMGVFRVIGKLAEVLLNWKRW